MKIAFIGLGNMGAPMAANLIAAGHELTGFDTAGIEVEGAAQASSGAAAAKGADVVITMLPNGAILKAVADEVIPVPDVPEFLQPLRSRAETIDRGRRRTSATLTMLGAIRACRQTCRIWRDEIPYSKVTQ